MTTFRFRGVYPAMCTPFDDDGSIDFETLRRDARRLEAAGVDGLVPCGSTGESATMSHDEHIEVIEAVVDAVEDVPVIAGSGSNNTREALSLSRRSAEAGADALLLISPYYNRPEQRGFVDHYERIADEVDLPQIVYNVPSRTGQNIQPRTVETLAEHPNVQGYKAASGDMGQISEIISVAANVEPERTCAMVGAALAEDFERARAIHHRLGPLFRGLFVETNPIPVKEAMQIRGYGPARVRSPLTRLSEEYRDELRTILDDLEAEPFDYEDEHAERER
ncbi:4-hydroxy-tetrahydrodipicolinate synthase [Halobacteriales archaeon QS_9_67_15]|nr:MAG: 4-hydroxy-tetrahydrodipicolinate synthase [Halobacteriales archaeon QS_9_67_15]